MRLNQNDKPWQSNVYNKNIMKPIWRNVMLIPTLGRMKHRIVSSGTMMYDKACTFSAKLASLWRQIDKRDRGKRCDPLSSGSAPFLWNYLPRPQLNVWISDQPPQSCILWSHRLLPSLREDYHPHIEGLHWNGTTIIIFTLISALVQLMIVFISEVQAPKSLVNE